MRFQLWRKIKAAPLGTYAMDRTPIVPGDLPISSVAGTYHVAVVSLDIQGLGGSTSTSVAWTVRARQVERFERFAKHRDYTQCTKIRSKTHEDPAA